MIWRGSDVRNSDVRNNGGRQWSEPVGVEFGGADFRRDDNDSDQPRMGDASAGSETGAARHHGMFESGKRFAISLIGHLRSRLELLGLEISQEKGRLVSVVMMALLGYLMVGVTLLLAVLLAVASSWDTVWRLHVIGAMLAGSIVILVVIGVVLRRRLQLRSTLFRSSLRELARDEQALERMS